MCSFRTEYPQGPIRDLRELVTLVETETNNTWLLTRPKIADPAIVQAALREKGFHILEAVDRSQGDDAKRNSLELCVAVSELLGLLTGF